jgi:DNA-binding beta-propeller fold protein YncE
MMRWTVSRTTLAVVGLLLSLTVACGRSEAPPPKTTSAPPVAATPAPPAMPEVGLYVTNETSGILTVIDVQPRAIGARRDPARTRQVTKKIPVGTGPWGIVFVKRAASVR